MPPIGISTVLWRRAGGADPFSVGWAGAGREWRRGALYTVTMNEINSRTIHAPSSVFVTVTMISTTPVTTAPKPLTAALDRHPGERVRRQWITIPACDSVN